MALLEKRHNRVSALSRALGHGGAMRLVDNTEKTPEAPVGFVVVGEDGNGSAVMLTRQETVQMRDWLTQVLNKRRGKLKGIK